MQHRAIENREHLEDGNQADGVRAQNEQEEGQDQRGPYVDPLLPDVRQHDRIPDELHDRLEAVHEPGRDEAVLLQIAADGPRDDDEHDRGDEPQHQDVLGHGEIDPEHLRQVNQGMIDPAVRHVLDDDLAGVELLGRTRFDEVLNRFLDEHHSRVRCLPSANKRLKQSASARCSAMK